MQGYVHCSCVIAPLAAVLAYSLHYIMHQVGMSSLLWPGVHMCHKRSCMLHAAAHAVLLANTAKAVP